MILGANRGASVINQACIKTYLNGRVVASTIMLSSGHLRVYNMGTIQKAKIQTKMLNNVTFEEGTKERYKFYISSLIYVNERSL